MASHAAPKPAPYAVALGAIAYSLAYTFHKHLPVEVVAAAPAAIVAAVAAIEHGLADAVKVADVVDPKLGADLAKEAPKFDRLAAQAEGAAKDVASGFAAASSSAV